MTYDPLRACRERRHPKKHVVMFSGGIGSWAAARRVAACHGTADLTLLFADTLIEDEDLYRFLDDAARDIGVPVTRIADGRTPWQVFRDVRFIGNTRVDPCSQILKREVCDRWLKDNCDPASTIVYVGIDWTEAHRFDDGQGRGAKNRMASLGWRAEAPLCHAPHRMKDALLQDLRVAGIEPPRLYAMGFPHNNCGGFCVKAGQAHFANLLKHIPDRFAEHAAEEALTMSAIGTDKTILRDRRGGTTKPMTLREFRLRVEGGKDFDRDEWGGCGCFSGSDADVFS